MTSWIWRAKLAAMRRDDSQCSSWLLCQDDKGCMDGSASVISKGICQLRQESRRPWGVPQQIIVQPSTFASGYVKREQPTLVQQSLLTWQPSGWQAEQLHVLARSRAEPGGCGGVTGSEQADDSACEQDGCPTSRHSGGRSWRPPPRCALAAAGRTQASSAAVLS